MNLITRQTLRLHRRRPFTLQHVDPKHLRQRRPFSDKPCEAPAPKRSPLSNWYNDILPGMIPVALLGSAVYLGLKLTQTTLANEKYIDEANARIAALEWEIDNLRAERDRRKAEGILGPPVVDKKSRWWFTGT